MENKVTVKVHSYVIKGFTVDETGMTTPRELVSPVRVKSIEGARKVIQKAVKASPGLEQFYVTGYEKRETVYLVPVSVIVENGEILDV